MKYYLFIDETGDHGLANIDDNFPIFMIGAILISDNEYAIFKQKVKQFKYKYFGDKKVILHSRDIRRINSPFEMLFDHSIKKEFYDSLNKIIVDTNFIINPVAVLKARLVEQYGKVADNPYSLSLNFVLERTVFDCDELGDCTELDIVIEKRGRREDAELLQVYQKIITRGTGYVSSERLNNLFKKIEFKDKLDDDEGLQLSDLISYPIARYILSPDLANPSYDLIKDKIRGKGYKVFP